MLTAAALIRVTLGPWFDFPTDTEAPVPDRVIDT